MRCCCIFTYFLLCSFCVIVGSMLCIWKIKKIHPQTLVWIFCMMHIQMRINLTESNICVTNFLWCECVVNVKNILQLLNLDERQRTSQNKKGNNEKKIPIFDEKTTRKYTIIHFYLIRCRSVFALLVHKWKRKWR